MGAAACLITHFLKHYPEFIFTKHLLKFIQIHFPIFHFANFIQISNSTTTIIILWIYHDSFCTLHHILPFIVISEC